MPRCVPTSCLRGPAIGLENIQRVRIFEFNPNWFIRNFFLAPHPALVPKHKFKSGEALTVTTTMASNNMFYARKANGLPGKAPNHESKKKMGIPKKFGHDNCRDWQSGAAALRAIHR